MNTLTDSPTIETETSMEQLKHILETQQKRSFAYAEVQEIAVSLVSLFELLAEGDSNDS
jgi:hypothetical protein